MSQSKAEKAADELVKAAMARVKVTHPSEVVCPREQSFMTPCIARDGATALADDGVCVGCGIEPIPELARVKEKNDG